MKVRKITFEVGAVKKTLLEFNFLRIKILMQS